ncbi:MAG: DUF1345 domain-containing protein [Alphaproteobacteria bacterium]|nr:DUF1345 domain-containing protein [Alphaproteobacteria bacterium]
MKGLVTFLSRHVRFYIALACGLATVAISHLMGFDAPLLAGGDVFYLIFLIICGVMIAGQKKADLKERAKSEDEGIAVVILITLATMGFFCDAVFTALSKKHDLEVTPLILAGIGAPLGWFVLHTVMAFHYADIHYFEDPDCADDDKDLEFPGRGDPGMWDFLYYSFVVGMTAQVSDVQVRTTVMRRATLLHGVVSFFFNTVFIAMAVNVGVTLAS